MELEVTYPSDVRWRFTEFDDLAIGDVIVCAYNHLPRRFSHIHLQNIRKYEGTNLDAWWIISIASSCTGEVTEEETN
jgi:hypothetical protein